MVFDLTNPTDIEIIKTYLNGARGHGLSVGLTSGSFDLIHFHHFLYFRRCRAYCHVLIVGVDSDELVRERKGEGRPIVYDSRRVTMVDALKPVAFAFVMNNVADFGVAAKTFTPDVILKSDAFEGRESEIVGREYAKRIQVIRDVVDHNSTTEILVQAAKIAVARKKE